MEEEFKQDIEGRITGYLDAIEASAETAGGFVAEQTPLVAQEYLAWVWWESSLLCVGGMVAVVCVLFATWKAFQWLSKSEEWELSPLLLLAVLPLCLFGGTAIHNGRQALKVTVAPRVVLLEKVAELMP